MEKVKVTNLVNLSWQCSGGDAIAKKRHVGKRNDDQVDSHGNKFPWKIYVKDPTW